MLRLACMLALGSATAALAFGCSHNEDVYYHVSATELYGARGPGRVGAPGTTYATRLAGSICRREKFCAAATRTPEANLLDEQACFTEMTDRVTAAMSTWSCSPAMARAGFEQCLAAINAERCSTKIDDPNAVLACRAGAVCDRGDLPATR